MFKFKSIVRAPANIAIVKYMGKADSRSNLPANPSLSMTLDRLSTWVEIDGEESEVPSFRLSDEAPAGSLDVKFFSGSLSKTAHDRAQAFFDRALPILRKILDDSFVGFRTAALTGRTANTFPTGVGIASSASSFAALTLAWALAFSRKPEKFRELFLGDPQFRQRLAALSRLGSGSSCRSFFGPWVAWEGEEVIPIASSLEPLVDLVLLIDQEPKRISSSEAHRRVETSELYVGRAKRAQARFQELKLALSRSDFSVVREIAGSETTDMHGLFHTAHPPFSYWTERTTEVLQELANPTSVSLSGLDAPAITLDAGPNIHLILLKSQVGFWKAALAQRFPGLQTIEDGQGCGAEVMGYFEVLG